MPRSPAYRFQSYGVQRSADGWEIIDVDVSGDRGDTCVISRSVIGTAPTEQEAERMARRLLLGLPSSADVVDLFFEDGCKDFGAHSRGMPAILERLRSANRLRAATPRRDKKVRLS
jgi:hypothetical protein